MIRRQILWLVAAFMLLTRIPLRIASLPDDWLPRSAKFFPLVGAVVGSAQAAMLVLSTLVLPGPLPAILSIAAALLLTGAFHEDGLADTFDSFGGLDAESRLAIMKDSRLGTYGALALAIALLLQVAALAALPIGLAVAALVAAHGGARCAGVLVMANFDHAGDPATAKVAGGAGRMSGGEIAVAIGFALLAALPFILLRPTGAILAVGIGVVAAIVMARGACGRIGGFTGDVLGAVATIFQVGVLIGASVAQGPLAV